VGVHLCRASKIGCTSETLRRWIRQAERNRGERSGPTTDERIRLKELERENRELKKTNEILQLASAYFAKAELDRRQTDMNYHFGSLAASRWNSGFAPNCNRFRLPTDYSHNSSGNAGMLEI